jgi:hypothetical protein
MMALLTCSLTVTFQARLFFNVIALQVYKFEHKNSHFEYDGPPDMFFDNYILRPLILNLMAFQAYNFEHYGPPDL